MEPDPTQVSPWYLRNITQALGLNSTTGEVYLRTLSGSNSSGVTPVSFAPTSTDSFGRLRVSTPLTLFDTQNRYFDHNLFATSTAGSGNLSYEADSSTFLLSVAGNGDAVYRETYKTYAYQPGKSLLILNTFCMQDPVANLTQRVGYFNDENGIFVETNGTTINLVIRSSSTGALIEDRVSQDDWNGDTLNGAGGASNLSGFNLNLALDQIFWIDVEWLGVGTVRCGFVINGEFILCHSFNHANTPSTSNTNNTTTYMTTACLPLRYEIISTGASGVMRQICSSVISEGGYSITGLSRAIGHNLGAPRSLPNDLSFVPLISIRLKSTNPDAIVVPINYTIAAIANSVYKYRIYTRAITSGGTWTTAGTDSSVEYNLAPGAITSGNIDQEAFIISSNQSSAAPNQLAFTFQSQLQRNPFTNTMYEYVITAATTGTNQSLYAAIEWQEVT